MKLGERQDVNRYCGEYNHPFSAVVVISKAECDSELKMKTYAEGLLLTLWVKHQSGFRIQFRLRCSH